MSILSTSRWRRREWLLRLNLLIQLIRVWNEFREIFPRKRGHNRHYSIAICEFGHNLAQCAISALGGWESTSFCDRDVLKIRRVLRHALQPPDKAGIEDHAHTYRVDREAQGPRGRRS